MGDTITVLNKDHLELICPIIVSGVEAECAIVVRSADGTADTGYPSGIDQTKFFPSFSDSGITAVIEESFLDTDGSGYIKFTPTFGTIDGTITLTVSMIDYESYLIPSRISRDYSPSGACETFAGEPTLSITTDSNLYEKDAGHPTITVSILDENGDPISDVSEVIGVELTDKSEDIDETYDESFVLTDGTVSNLMNLSPNDDTLQVGTGILTATPSPTDELGLVVARSEEIRFYDTYRKCAHCSPPPYTVFVTLSGVTLEDVFEGESAYWYCDGTYEINYLHWTNEPYCRWHPTDGVTTDQIGFDVPSSSNLPGQATLHINLDVYSSGRTDIILFGGSDSQWGSQVGRMAGESITTGCDTSLLNITNSTPENLVGGGWSGAIDFRY